MDQAGQGQIAPTAGQGLEAAKAAGRIDPQPALADRDHWCGSKGWPACRSISHTWWFRAVCNSASVSVSVSLEALIAQTLKFCYQGLTNGSCSGGERHDQGIAKRSTRVER